MVVGLEIEEKTVWVKRELEAGAFEAYTMELPTLLTIQTGINQPRYLSLACTRRRSWKKPTFPCNIRLILPASGGKK